MDGKNCTAEHLSDQAPPVAATRRAWIAAAGGGLVLAAGGLLVPDWREAGAVRQGAFDGKLGGRHGKNRRGRDNARRRNKDARRRDTMTNRNEQPRSGLHLLWIKFYVYNDRPVTTPNGSSTVRGWGNETGGISEKWQRLPLISLPNGSATGEFELSGYEEGAIVVDDRFYIEADNSISFAPPLVRLYYGGTMTEDGYQGGTRVVNGYYLKEFEKIQETMDGRLFTMKRLKDIDDYKVYDVRFT